MNGLFIGHKSNIFSYIYNVLGHESATGILVSFIKNNKFIFLAKSVE